MEIDKSKKKAPESIELKFTIQGHGLNGSDQNVGHGYPTFESLQNYNTFTYDWDE